MSYILEWLYYVFFHLWKWYSWRRTDKCSFSTPINKKNTQKANLYGISQEVTKVQSETGLLTPGSLFFSGLCYIHQLILWLIIFQMGIRSMAYIIKFASWIYVKMWNEILTIVNYVSGFHFWLCIDSPGEILKHELAPSFYLQSFWIVGQEGVGTFIYNNQSVTSVGDFEA